MGVLLPVQVVEKVAGQVEIHERRVGLDGAPRERGEEGVRHQRGRQSPVNLDPVA